MKYYGENLIIADCPRENRPPVRSLVIEGKTFDLIYRNLGEYAKENKCGVENSQNAAEKRKRHSKTQ